MSKTSFEVIREELRELVRASPATVAWEEGALASGVRVTGSTTSFIPLHCSLQLTNACNLRCTFCYANSGHPYANELDTRRWLEVLEKLATHGVAAVTLTGGEPTLAKGFRTILTVASSYLPCVDVFTNGIPWNGANVELAATLGNVRCQISIDGMAERHDRIRGQAGAYRRSLETIRRLDEAGVQVLVAMTATPDNWRDVPAVIDEVAEAGARSYRLGVVQPIGRGAEGDYWLSDEQQESVKRMLLEAGKRQTRMQVIDWGQCGRSAEDEASDLEGIDFCTPGYQSWHIRANGRVTPCQIEATSMGHILEDSMLEIGSPERLARARATSRSCRCIGHVALPDEPGIPFS
jgi:sporulation killing factor system radical SAM maturase